MQPYYQDDTTTIYRGDCRDILPSLPTVADLIVTDPPYGVGWESGWRAATLGKIVGDDGSLDVPEALSLALRVLREGRHVYVFGRFDFGSLPFGSTAELIWDKEIAGPGDLSLPWGPSHEPISFAVYRSSKANRAAGHGRLAARLRQGSVIRCQRKHSSQVQQHPTEKPVDIIRQLIESSSLLGETVLDPFMGSGSTLVAARMESRHGIGIEVDERYCEVAAKRLGQGVLDFGGAA